MSKHNKKKAATISYFVHEGEMSRWERCVKRMAIVTVSSCVVSALLVLLEFRQRGKIS